MYDVSILETILRRRMYLNGSNTCCPCLCTFSMLSSSNMYMNRAQEHVYENWFQVNEKVHKLLYASILKAIYSKKNFKTEHTLSFIYRLD